VFEALLAGKGINKDIPIPYYYQIAQILRNAIADADIDSVKGEIGFLSETELCAVFDVTRATVRHALDVVEREGLIYREKGRGTFVRRRRLALDVTTLRSTTEDLKARGWTPGTKVMSVRRMAPRPHIRRALDLRDDEEVWEVFRLRLADEEPMSLQWSYVPCARTLGLDQEDLSGSLYRLLESRYGIRPTTADQEITTRVLTSAREAELLGNDLGDPVFVISRTVYDQNRSPIERFESRWRGDRYSLRSRLQRRD